MRVYIETYGCTANKSDESTILGLLKKGNHIFVDIIKEADVIIILTCTVIGTTEQRMLSRLREFKKTNAKLIVAGCMPQVQEKLIKSIAPKASLLPPQYVTEINSLIETGKHLTITNEKNTLYKHFKDISAPISIAQGCIFSCSYCITHFARGELQSFSQDSIITTIKQALDQGCKEILLTAQDTASYGIDTQDTLGDLLKNVCKIHDEFRVRVGMMNPYTAQKNLSSIIESYMNNKIYKFLHLPVQSGDNDVLKKMNRKYQIKDFKKIVSIFREKYPLLTLSTDIIVGFPGETDEQFNRSIQLIKDMKPDIVNITRFSPRPLTKAKALKDRLPTKIVKGRSKELSSLCKEITIQKNENHLGKIYKILIVKGEEGLYIGRAGNYKPVEIQDTVQIGSFVRVKIVDSRNIHLVGKLI
jgi:MiaB-like tRNA modifying enzyme